MSEPTLMRIRCHQCHHAVITPNDPFNLAGHAMMLTHFVDTGHRFIRAAEPEDIMQPYFVIAPYVPHAAGSDDA